VAYRFIVQHQEKFGLRWLLNRMSIFPNAYYNCLKQAKADYQAKKESVNRKIKRIYHETGGILGYRSMRIFLSREQILLSKSTVHKYLNKYLQLYSICRRKRPNYKENHAHKIFPNLLTDQGSQFTSVQFILYCQEHGVIQSMSAAGCPFDNSPMERKVLQHFQGRIDQSVQFPNG